MEHPPSEFKADIPMTYSEMHEVHKAIMSKVFDIVTKANLDEDVDEDYVRYRIETLMIVGARLDALINTAVEEWEAGIAGTEARALDDIGAVEKFLSPGWCGLPQEFLDAPDEKPEN
jgi:hypothetical protein